MNWLQKLLGRRFLLNINTGETHDFNNMKKRCGFVDHKNRRFVSYKKFKSLKGKFVNNKYVNGCRWCMPKHDLG